MKIAGSIALVTGANRGIGRAFVGALTARGAAKIYATARDPLTVADLEAADPGLVEAIALDVTDFDAVASVAGRCADTTLLVNNAGAYGNVSLLRAPDLNAARREMETNYFGTLAMCRAFAPKLAQNGGGCIVNMLSLLSQVSQPAVGSYCASKAAELSLTQGIRAEVAGQGTLVVAVLAGPVDTDMIANSPSPKIQPEEAAATALDAVESGTEDVYAGDLARTMGARLLTDPKGVEKEFAKYLGR